MIDNNFLTGAREIRKNYLKIINDLKEYEIEIKKLSDFLFEKADFFKTLQKEKIEKGKNEADFFDVCNTLVKEMNIIELEEGKVAKKINELNNKLELLKSEELNLYNAIKKRYPKLSDEEIKTEINIAIKDLNNLPM